VVEKDTSLQCVPPENPRERKSSLEKEKSAVTVGREDTLRKIARESTASHRRRREIQFLSPSQLLKTYPLQMIGSLTAGPLIISLEADQNCLTSN
jgi:hypothetical protein